MGIEPKFEVYKDHAGKFRWRLRASNGEEIASGQGYKSKEDCMKGVKSVKTNALKAPIRQRILDIDLTSIKEGTSQLITSGSSVLPQFFVSEKSGTIHIYPLHKKHPKGSF